MQSSYRAFPCFQARTYLLLAVLPPALLIAATLIQSSYPIQYLYMDPITAAEIAFKRTPNPDEHTFRILFGSMSIVGSLVWFSAIPPLLLAAAETGRRGARDLARTLLIGAALTAVLVLDDAFLVHEKIGDIFENADFALFGAYALFGCAYLWRLLSRHRGDFPPTLLILALGCFGLSVLADFVWHGGHRGPAILFEDAPKVFGIFAWTTFHFGFSYGALVSDRAAPTGSSAA